MLATFITVQSACLAVSTFMAYKSVKKSKTLKLYKKYPSGFKHYKAGGY